MSIYSAIQPELNPMWDEGISSYLYGEYEKRQEPLSIDNLQTFALDQAVRIGDLLETLFLMSIYGAWVYTDAEGKEQILDESMLDTLYSKGRLTPEELKAFNGLWSPVG